MRFQFSNFPIESERKRTTSSLELNFVISFYLDYTKGTLGNEMRNYFMAFELRSLVFSLVASHNTLDCAVARKLYCITFLIGIRFSTQYQRFSEVSFNFLMSSTSYHYYLLLRFLFHLIFPIQFICKCCSFLYFNTLEICLLPQYLEQ